MDMIYVKPADGGRVRQPERQFRVMPAEGAFVPRDAHYERLLAAGDVVAAEVPAAPAAEPAQPKPTTSSGGRRPARASEE